MTQNDREDQFSSASGERFELEVQRTGAQRGELQIRVFVDDREVMSDRLGPGEAGPVTLAGEVP